jgi:hypothetical protein
MYGVMQYVLKIILGYIVACLTGVSLIGGTVMTIIGNKKMKEFKLKQDGLKVGLYCAPNHAGFTVSCRF